MSPSLVNYEKFETSGLTMALSATTMHTVLSIRVNGC